MPNRQNIKQADDILPGVTGSLGKLEGVIETSLKHVSTEMSRLNSAIIQMGIELDHKHEENIRRIETKHIENMSVLAAQTAALVVHKEEDTKNFQQVFKWQSNVVFGFKMAAAFWSVTITIAAGAWAVFQWLIPLLMQAKGLGD